MWLTADKGQSHLSYQAADFLLQRKSSDISSGDRVRTACRLVYELAQRGEYDRSIALLQETRLIVKGTLKAEQRVLAFAEVVGLMRSIRRFVIDLDTAR